MRARRLPRHATQTKPELARAMVDDRPQVLTRVIERRDVLGQDGATPAHCCPFKAGIGIKETRRRTFPNAAIKPMTTALGDFARNLLEKVEIVWTNHQVRHRDCHNRLAIPILPG
jgi:hypothetical protein